MTAGPPPGPAVPPPGPVDPPPVPPFGARLASAVAARGPLCVGLDPHRSLLQSWGLPDDVEGLRRFTDTCLDALAGHVAVLKPQMAFYERHGARGVAVLEKAVPAMRAAGALVLLDAKRGDIGSTMDAYAEYLLARHPMQVDALTVSPFLGPGSLEPARAAAVRSGGGLFVLARTSNPDAGTFQHARVPTLSPEAALPLDAALPPDTAPPPDAAAGERTVAQAVVDTVRGWNTPAWLVTDPPTTIEQFMAAGSGWDGSVGSFGVVVGATLHSLDVDLDGLRGPVLAPGLGAQGGSVADLHRLFGRARAVVPTVSRDVLGAGPGTAALRAAADRWTADLTG
ncbi:orotidine-5'-phosphate decarboxylase [Modestobacter sp. I12A-02628]|uniref:Orotidine-5'-phosphate decarboxylase n=1 Tax=Goekera deserti TaxID=2497753 RepID=A0A7K3WBX0_9ACTN|nr:orotidine-5'-phosphate decarboxylase [Goekera deserti]MPQ99144.1 orotidine-5'-phosphate decarboxylase [Goekera deserti]NDI47479.1 orotidine-5'-phosphate decarboxylase [Goekera deserti]NEL53290.1 orotidine-5'-phosphate decarboxylase [Goekera deserti]